MILGTRCFYFLDCGSTLLAFEAGDFQFSSEVGPLSSIGLTSPLIFKSSGGLVQMDLCSAASPLVLFDCNPSVRQAECFRCDSQCLSSDIGVIHPAMWGCSVSLEFSLHLGLFVLLFGEVLKIISGVLAFFFPLLPLLPPSWFIQLIIFAISFLCFRSW